MKDKLQLFIQNEGDDDSNLWVVVDEQNKAYFSSRSRLEAEKFVSNYNPPQKIESNFGPNSPNWENSFISELAHEIDLDSLSFEERMDLAFED